MMLMPGTRLGPYEIVAALGAGGMGEVYRARDPRLGRDVAVKVLPPAFSADPERLTRFEQEARAAAALNHPNILAVYDVGQHDGSPYIVSELLEGETLRERLAAGALPVRKALEYAVQIAQGLAAAHEKGIVHRDLKPENVVVTGDGRVKILDFGLAKLTQAEPVEAGISALPTTPPHTQAGIVLGTFGYMSPEQVRGLVADHRADIFALGTLLYEMLSGQRAFRGDTAADSMTAILKEDPPDLPVAERRIPPALDRIVNRCLEKNPANRFQTAVDLTFAIEGISSQSDAFRARDGRFSGRPARRELAAWSGVAIVSVFAAALGWNALDRATPDAERSVHATLLPPENWTLTGTNPAARLAVSPDGLRLAFVANGPDRRSMLWVRRFDSLAPQPLQGTEGATSPFWSPDSRFLGFFASGKLKRIDASGGPAVTLCDAPYTRGGAVPGGAWNRDGVILFGSSGASLQHVSASGGIPARVTTLQGQETSHQLPFFLPDGQHFLFQVAIGSSASAGAVGSEIRIGSLDSPEVRPLMKGTSQAMYAGHLLFVRDQTLMVQAFDAQRLELSDEPVPLAEQIVSSPSGGSTFSVSQNGVLVYQAGPSALSPSRLVWIDREGKEVATLGDVAAYGDVQLSSDGRRAAVSLLQAESNTRDVWIFDLARGVPARFTFDAANDLAAIWSPGDDRVVFSSARAGRLDLYEKASTMVGDETILLADSADKYPLSWSRDGRFILYSVIEGRNQDLWALPLFGDRKPFPFARSTFSETAGQFSPNGKWIAYRSDESGRPEIWAGPFPGPGRRTQISTEGAGAGYPRWDRDGKELYYLDAASRLMAVQVSADGSELQIGTIRPLFETRASFRLRSSYDISPDGQRFLINSNVGEAAPITLVVNWAAMLKK